MRAYLHMLAVTSHCHADDRSRRTPWRGVRRRSGVGLRLLLAGLTLFACLGAGRARAEDGHDLWLRYSALTTAPAGIDRGHAVQLIAGQGSPTEKATRSELLRGLGGLLGTAPALSGAVTRDGALIAGTSASSPVWRACIWTPGISGPRVT